MSEELKPCPFCETGERIWERRAKAALPVLLAAVELVSVERATYFDVTLRTGARVIHDAAFDKLAAVVDEYKRRRQQEG